MSRENMTWDKINLKKAFYETVVYKTLDITDLGMYNSFSWNKRKLWNCQINLEDMIKFIQIGVDIQMTFYSFVL